MTDEVRDFDDELQKLLKEIKSGLEALDSASDRKNKHAYLENRLTRAKQVLRSFKVELRELPRTEAEPYMRVREHIS